jgi:hypothetical protein
MNILFFFFDPDSVGINPVKYFSSTSHLILRTDHLFYISNRQISGTIYNFICKFIML